MAIYQVQAQDYYLAGSGISLSQTTIDVLNLRLPNPTPNQGTVLLMTMFGDIGYGTLEPETDNEENFSFTGITNNGNGTWTLTGVTRGLSFIRSGNVYPQDNALRRAHGGGTIMRFSNSSNFYEIFANKSRVQTITGLWTFNADADGANPKIDDISYVPDPDDYIVAAYVDDTFLRLDGTNSPMLGAVDFGGFNITNMADGVAAQDAVTVNQLQTAIISGALPATTVQQGIVLVATQADWDNTVDYETIGLNQYLNVPPISMIQAGIQNYISSPTNANLFDDFMGSKAEIIDGADFGGSSIGALNWTIVTETGEGGTNARVYPIDGETGRPGIIRLQSDDANSESTAIILGGTSIILISAGNLTTSTNTGTISSFGPMNQGNWTNVFSARPEISGVRVFLGIVGQTADVNLTDGIYFKLDDGIDGDWRGICRSGGVETAVVGPAAVNDWTKFEIVMNAAGTEVEFFIDSVSIGTVNTNIPNVGGTPQLLVHTRTGNTIRLCDVDYWSLNMTGLTR